MGKKLTTEEFIKKSKATHKNKYDYKLSIYKNATSKIKIICHEHGVFEKTSWHHIAGNGCPKCGWKKYGLSKKMGQETFVNTLLP